MLNKLQNAMPFRTVAAAALIDTGGKIFLAKRPEGKALAGLWEFPGGKLELGETPETALARELREELDIETPPGAMIPLTFASQEVAGGHLLLLLFAVHKWQGMPRAMEAPEIGWFDISEISDLPMPPADAPFIPLLKDYLARDGS